MSFGKKKQIFSLLKWRKGKKQKNEKQQNKVPDDLDCGSNQFKQEPSLFGKSRSEDSGLDLSNSSCLYLKRVSSDTRENNSIHSRHTSNSSSLYSYLSCDSRPGLFPRSFSFAALSGTENEAKAIESPMEDNVFGLNNITQTLNVSYNLEELTELTKSDLTVSAVSKNVTEKDKENGHEIIANNWRHTQLRENSMENKIMSSGISNQMRIGMLYRLCSLMEKITELERDRLELQRRNQELKDQLTQSQQAQIIFLSCCTCDARAGLNTSPTATQQTTSDIENLCNRDNEDSRIFRSQCQI
ncbi:uncharacterized protein LOC134348882 isoform X1 [Mobula hypostoma]|uniref:uncharacterized protein LOC134348882 isoform X1 n=1 Tax=Mobula hypostoma TaxID=723540 RepID=UPI002FC384F0